MKGELTDQLLFAAGGIGVASVGTVKGLPAEHAVFLWSIAGTMAGAVAAAAAMPSGVSRRDRFLRVVLCFTAGLILAPFAIDNLPRGAIPDWWFSFAASGVAAFLAFVVAAELPPLVKGWLKETFGAKRRR